MDLYIEDGELIPALRLTNAAGYTISSNITIDWDKYSVLLVGKETTTVKDITVEIQADHDLVTWALGTAAQREAWSVWAVCTQANRDTTHTSGEQTALDQALLDLSTYSAQIKTSDNALSGLLYLDSNGVGKQSPLYWFTDVLRNDFKADYGLPGTITGCDFGEGGSYKYDTNNTDTQAEIIKMYQYDASKASGTRFTKITDADTQYTWLGESGDRVYVGSPYKFWGCRLQIGVAKSNEEFLIKHYNGASMSTSSYMVEDKNTGDSLGKVFLEGSVGDKEYVAWDRSVDNDWSAADNVLDMIPNDGASLYWIAIENPSILSTSPRTDEFRLRGTDLDIQTGLATIRFWGDARHESHHNKEVSKVFNDGATDEQTIYFSLPPGCDTSCDVYISIDYYSTNNLEVEFEIDHKRLTQDTDITGVKDGTATKNHTPDTNKWEKHIGIADIGIGGYDLEDTMKITLRREGVTDANTGTVTVQNILVHYVQYKLGNTV